MDGARHPSRRRARFVAHRRREISILGPRVFDAGRVRDRHQLIHRSRVISRIHRTHERVALDAQRGVGAHRRDAQARGRGARDRLSFPLAQRAARLVHLYRKSPFLVYYIRMIHSPLN